VSEQRPAEPPSSETPRVTSKRSGEDIALLGCLVLVLITILPLFLILMGGSVASIPAVLILVVAVYMLLKLSFRLFGVEQMAARERARCAPEPMRTPTSRPRNGQG
jgi:hypothetical protein